MWQQGSSLDVGEWLAPKEGKTQAVIISVAHFDDQKRALALGVIFEEILAYTRGLGRTNRLRAVVAIDEVYGLVPPHPQNPPTKRPIVTLMKRARLGLVSYFCWQELSPFEHELLDLYNPSRLRFAIWARGINC